MNQKQLAAKRGMTLIEMLLALTIFGMVMAGALSFLRSQSRGYAMGTDRAAILQNMRYAANTLGKDLRTVGSGVPDNQPFLVYAGAAALAFNADYTTNVANDPFATYFDPDAPLGSVTALTQGERAVLTGTAFAYPDTTYLGFGGTNSRAETITFFFDPDTSTARTDDYVLFRQINHLKPEVVSRNLLQTSGLPFFEYFRLVAPFAAPLGIQPVPAGWLPLAHRVPVHLSPGDTAINARIDSLRGVRVNFTATNGRTGADERTRAITRLVRMPNAGLASRSTCGDEPILGAALVAGVITLPGGAPAVALAWNPATDETGGEKDVIRYVIWRRLQADLNWGDPYVSIPAGVAAYSYTDQVVTPGDTYMYALAAQDCTPLESQLATAGPLTIP